MKKMCISQLAGVTIILLSSMVILNGFPILTRFMVKDFKWSLRT